MPFSKTSDSPSISGIAMKDRGILCCRVNMHIMLTCGGFHRSLERTEAWTELLMESHITTKTRDFRYLFAVKGPKDSLYNARELKTTLVASHILTLMEQDTSSQLLVLAHSSGGFVCGDFLKALSDEAKKRASGNPLVTADRVTYFLLDGGAPHIAGLAKANFFRTDGLIGVNAQDTNTHKQSANFGIADIVGKMVGGRAHTVMVTSNCPNQVDGGKTGTFCVHNALLCLQPKGNSGCPHSVAELESSYLELIPFNSFE
jgi:hypothetical protein